MAWNGSDKMRSVSSHRTPPQKNAHYRLVLIVLSALVVLSVFFYVCIVSSKVDEAVDHECEKVKSTIAKKHNTSPSKKKSRITKDLKPVTSEIEYKDYVDLQIYSFNKENFEKIINKLKENQLNVTRIENSTFNVEKPKMMGEVSIEDIAEMAEEEIEMLLEQGKISLDREMYIIKQFLVSNIDGKGEPVDDGSAKYYKDLAQFILDSELSTDVLYKEDLFDPNSELLEEFLSITNPNDGFEKLDIDILGKRSRLSTSDGSVPTSL